MSGRTEGQPGSKIVPVFVTTDLALAEIVKSTLIHEGIQCELERQMEGTFVAVVNVRVLVRVEDFERAREVIEKRQEHPESV